MSELIYRMRCPLCGREADVMFDGSGRNGTCMKCGYDLPPTKTYLDYAGRVISYNG